MKTKDCSGFTLVEVMISVALVVVIIGITTTSWLALAKASNAATQCAELHADMRRSFDIMLKDLKCASDLVDFGSSGTPFLRVMAERAGGPQNVYYIFSAERLYQVDTASRVLAEDIADMEYTLYEEDGITQTSIADDAYSVDIKITGAKTIGGEVFEDVVQSRVKFRNKGL